MTARIILLGATGYTGQRTARSLFARGAAPVLAGRDTERLSSLAAELGGLETVHADASNPESLRRLVRPKDVLISTVGPFSRLGHPVIEAAIAAGATYFDSTGEAPFIRDVFTRYGTESERAGAALVTAFGSDWVPGNLAGALALRQAKSSSQPVATLQLGYFLTGGTRHSISRGTVSSIMEVSRAPSHRMRGGSLTLERTAARLRHFDVDGQRRPAFTVGGTEQFALPRLAPSLTDVDVYLGWFGRASRAAHLLSPAAAVLTKTPGAASALSRLGTVITSRLPAGPAPEQGAGVTSQVVAEAYDRRGTLLARARVDGPEPYAMTADLLAWGAMYAAEAGLHASGALGPVDAFGLETLEHGAAQAGLTGRILDPDPS